MRALVIFAFLLKITTSTSPYYEKRVLENYEGPIDRDVLSINQNIGSIELFHCNITRIDNGVLCLPPLLQTLNLQADVIFPILDKTVFKYCHNLVNLIISRISIDPGAFSQGLNKIERVNFFAVNVNEVILKETLKGLEKAWDLQIVKSHVKWIHRDAFEDMTKLTELNLEDNEIETIEIDTFRTLKKLERLRLNNNKLSTLSWNEFRGLRLLDTLAVNGNPGLWRTWRDLLQNLPQQCPYLRTLEIGNWFENGDANRRIFEDELPKKFTKLQNYY